jgi:hypothetical protein
LLRHKDNLSTQFSRLVSTKGSRPSHPALLLRTLRTLPTSTRLFYGFLRPSFTPAFMDPFARNVLELQLRVSCRSFGYYRSYKLLQTSFCRNCFCTKYIHGTYVPLERIINSMHSIPLRTHISNTMDLTHYHAQYRVVVCNRCRSAVVPNHILGHLCDFHGVGEAQRQKRDASVLSTSRTILATSPVLPGVYKSHPTRYLSLSFHFGLYTVEGYNELPREVGNKQCRAVQRLD